MVEPPTTPEEHPVFTPLHAAIWVMGAYMTLVAAALVLLGLRPDVEKDLVSLGALNSAVFLLVSALLLGKYPGGSRLGASVGLGPVSPLFVVLGLVIGATIHVPAGRVQGWIERLAPLTKEQVGERLAMFTPESAAHAALLFVVAVLLVPWAEEMFFRGAVFGALRRSGSTGLAAAVITGIGFTISHFDPRLWIVILLVAAVFGLLRACSGSLWPSLAAHVGFNGVTIVGAIVAWKTKTEGVELTLQQELLGVGLLLGALAAFVALARVAPSAIAARRREERVGD